MINVRFFIENPYSDFFKNCRCWSKKITKHKAWELQTYRTNTIIEFELELSHRRDHAGFRIGFGFFSFNITFQIYDTRHWDYENGRWERYD